jgi:hypothetical protein
VADRIVAATGDRPDHSISAELHLDLDPILGSARTLAPLISVLTTRGANHKPWRRERAVRRPQTRP